MNKISDYILTIAMVGIVWGCLSRPLNHHLSVARESRKNLQDYIAARAQRDQDRVLAQLDETIALVKQKLGETYQQGWRDCTHYIISNYMNRVHIKTITVTQECTRQHWPEPGQSMKLPMFPSTWPSNFTVPGFGGKTSYDERAVIYSNITYVVKVEYNDSYCFVPAVAGVQNANHYDATFTVFLNDQQIGEPMRGQYTEWKCFEDSPPERWVIKALEAVVVEK